MSFLSGSTRSWSHQLSCKTLPVKESGVEWCQNCLFLRKARKQLVACRLTTWMWPWLELWPLSWVMSHQWSRGIDEASISPYSQHCLKERRASQTAWGGWDRLFIIENLVPEMMIEQSQEDNHHHVLIAFWRMKWLLALCSWAGWHQHCQRHCLRLISDGAGHMMAVGTTYLSFKLFGFFSLRIKFQLSSNG